MSGPDIVEVEGLRVALTGGRSIVHGVDLRIGAGEILGLVGQSGSGKTTVGLSLLAYVRHGARFSGGTVRIEGEDVLSLDDDARTRLRGRRVAYVPQDPRASLNPGMTIGAQIGEVLDGRGERIDADERAAAVRAALEDVGLASDTAFQHRFPHQLSGGQLQRVGIAMAIAAGPRVLVLDEPTTGLDVLTQTRILALVRRVCTERRIAGLYVTHDLAVVADIADRIAVMHDGAIVEEGDVLRVFREPQDAYTRALLAAAPDILDVRAPEPPAASGDAAAVLAVSGLAAGYGARTVIRDAAFDLGPGECLAVVGESGSGKTTLSRALIGLHPRYTGTVQWRGVTLPHRAGARSRQQVQELQYIFQSPFSALNPRCTIGDSIASAHREVFPRARRADRLRAVHAALAQVSLDPSLASQLPGRLSGGERQRVAIARALVTEPRVLICDEITSALDVLVQASIVDLLRDLRRSAGLSLVFVTHNLALVRSFASRVLVLEHGEVVEVGPTEEVLSAPRHPYTRQLVENTPSIRATLERRAAEVGSPGPGEGAREGREWMTGPIAEERAL